MTVRSQHRARSLVRRCVDWALRTETAERRSGTHRSGVVAPIWATIKLGIAGLGAPLWAPTLMGRAAANHRRARDLITLFPTQLQAIENRRRPTAPANRVKSIPADCRMLIVSDLHRCIAGRLDWPERQGTKDLYEHMLDQYATEGWELCENGDIEDYWMVGGSLYGTVYDILRIAGAGLAFFGRSGVLVETYRSHLDQIVANNEGIYRRIREGFARDGRYHRTIGNHDDPNSRPSVADRLRDHLGAVSAVDYVAMRHSDGSLAALVCHGHHTDGWCAPGRDYLGKLSTWFANTLVDVPGVDSPEGLPPTEATDQLLGGRSPNRLITVDPTFGATSSYDSLDEELLFRSMDPPDDGPWLLMGHTHSPVTSPRSESGRAWARYANSGCGVNREMITALEWDGTGDQPTVQLVAWTFAATSTGRSPVRIELSAGADGLLETTSTPTGVAETA